MDQALRTMAATQRTENDEGPAQPPAPPRKTTQAGESPPASVPQLLASDREDGGSDLLGRTAHATFVAELLLHRGAETPFCVGILGEAGTGKSAFAGQIVAAAEQIAAASAEAGLASAFASHLLVVRADAAGSATPDETLQRAVLRGVAAGYPDLAAELSHAGADPREVVRARTEDLAGLRRRLDGERQALDDLRGREARLLEIAADSPGSTLDLYARTKRSRIARALRPFGFAKGDPVASFKGLVREAAEQPGAGARLGLSLRALYAFRGQARLIGWAVGLGVVASAAAILRNDTGWIDALRGTSERAGPVADWIVAHLDWLGRIETAALVAALALLAVNVLRAARFMLPLSRGIDLLHADADARRRDLTGALAHQTRRTDALAHDVEVASAALAAAEARATASGAGVASSSLPASGPAATFAALAAALADRGSGPERILVVLDDLEADPARGLALLAATRRLFRSGMVALAAGDTGRLAGHGEAAEGTLVRLIQVPVWVDAVSSPDVLRRGFAMALFGRGGAGEPRSAALPDTRRSALDAAWTEQEIETVAAVAPLAGDNPRSVKRYVNLYRVARADPRLAGGPGRFCPALALGLALDIRGGAGDRAALAEGRGMATPGGTAALQQAIAKASAALGDAVDAGTVKTAFEVAATYSISASLAGRREAASEPA